MLRTQFYTNLASPPAALGFVFVMCLMVVFSVERSVTQLSLAVLCEGSEFRSPLRLGSQIYFLLRSFGD